MRKKVNASLELFLDALQMLCLIHGMEIEGDSIYDGDKLVSHEFDVDTVGWFYRDENDNLHANDD